MAKVKDVWLYINGLPLHSIRKEVKPIQNDSLQVLGAELVKQFTVTEYWRQ